ncbi:probable transmembrane protein [Thiobacillus denitrificans ATCC 25259]|uniref:Probable transmembrane protein n=1 Tax=Thiobacillus denitrificans (strain ATCC 25259 / T1) TaxID=292415 RepID=Q3SLK2_THIDA|nr:YdcF family protein [Thiobacillus denitrificans]AAZ96405.1 probable transmembrane protein [Thiobacillus denitrificans ATCC 25259]
MTAWLATDLIAIALLPPLSLVIVLGAGIAIRRRNPRLAMSLILVSTAALYALSTPWVGGLLLKSLEISVPVDPARLQADAIVVLSGGRRMASREYGGDTLNGISLERLRYAVRLHRATGLPLLVTGGNPGGGTLAEGQILAQVLRDDYGIEPRWVEDAALTTWDNARLSAPLLKKSGVHRIALVTHAWHLRRAVPLFEAQELEVIPAGIQFASTDLDRILDLLPTPAGLRDSSFALHEWLGILWYKLRSNF